MENDRIFELIAKELKNEASDFEKSELAAWRTKNDYNQSIYDDAAKIWDKYGHFPLNHNFDAGEAWQRFSSALANQPSENEQPHRWLKIAASIILVTVAGYFIYSFQQNRDQVHVATGSSKSEMILLVDGSKVWLNKNSTFEYPEKFDADTRTVSLDGEGYFEVAPNSTQPFIIFSEGGARVEVVGTAFNYFTSADSSAIVVTEGKVAFGNAIKNQFVTPGLTGTLTSDLSVQATEDPNFDAWKTGVLSFNETPLNKVISTLSKHYDSKIVLELESESACQLSSHYDNMDLNDILEELQLLYNLERSDSPEGILLNGTSCE
ncbi:MAG: FecR domain-containing protein [Cyclobacteriaceae bacterium]